jgi:molecular chaperone GrpE (heat shock protein)
MRIISLKVDEGLLGVIEDLTELLNEETGLKISRHSVMLKALSKGVKATLKQLRDAD